MAGQFRALLDELRLAAAVFDDANRHRQEALLAALAQCRLPLTATLTQYANVLMFIAAHPRDEHVLQLARTSLDRLADFMRRQPYEVRNKLHNTGLPYTPAVSTYSHDLLAWMLCSTDYRVSFDSFWRPEIRLSQALAFTLPSLECDQSATGCDGMRLLEHLVARAPDRLAFLLAEFARLNDRPALKDYLFDGLHLYLRVTPTDRSFSKAFNRITTSAHFFHTRLIKRIDTRQVIGRRMPPPRRLVHAERDAVVKTARQAMMLLQRETDPTTHLDPRSLRVYDLERGVAVAIYGMVAARQLPLESYVGYTLFKNGYPAAYGGAWIFGRRARFGINIFEPFRGGESGLLLCQLLRVYRRVFGVDYFEVEPYQYGRRNPEGIRSGAFWFYYRQGFRPIEPELAEVARNERNRINANRRHRTPAPVLRQLARGNIALQLGGHVPTSVADVRARITDHIRLHYNGDRVSAESQCRRLFALAAGSPGRLHRDGQRVYTEVALWAQSSAITSGRSLALLRRMIRVKPVDLYGYQQLLLKVLR
jgi:hypothetical protein